MTCQFEARGNSKYIRSTTENRLNLNGNHGLADGITAFLVQKLKLLILMIWRNMVLPRLLLNIAWLMHEVRSSYRTYSYHAVSTSTGASLELKYGTTWVRPSNSTPAGPAADTPLQRNSSYPTYLAVLVVQHYTVRYMDNKLAAGAAGSKPCCHHPIRHPSSYYCHRDVDDDGRSQQQD